MVDSRAAFSWFGDFDVMKWIPAGPHKEISQTEERIQKYIEHFKKHGFSKFILIEKSGEKSSHSAIGDAGPMYLPGTNFIELGYRIKKSHWGRGLASEAAFGILKYFFENLNMNEIHSVVEPENPASIHIVENKLKFDFIKKEEFFGVPMNLYKMDKKKYGLYHS